MKPPSTIMIDHFNNLSSKSFLVLSIFIIFQSVSYAQVEESNSPEYGIHKTYSYPTISRSTLIDATSINDLKDISRNQNLSYDPSWVRDFISVEVSAHINGKNRTETGKNHELNQSQKRLIRNADNTSEISVKIKYIPENDLVNNDSKELSFAFKVAPDRSAVYPGGELAMRKYLMEKIIEHLPTNSFEGYDLTSLKFTIDTQGEVTDIRIFDPINLATSDNHINRLLITAIEKMHCWQPAEYQDGTKATEDYVLTVGNMENCVVQLLNISPNN